jgi:hypothetical protein
MGRMGRMGRIGGIGGWGRRARDEGKLPYGGPRPTKVAAVSWSAGHGGKGQLPSLCEEWTR